MSYIKNDPKNINLTQFSPICVHFPISIRVITITSMLLLLPVTKPVTSNRVTTDYNNNQSRFQYFSTLFFLKKGKQWKRAPKDIFSKETHFLLFLFLNTSNWGWSVLYHFETKGERGVKREIKCGSSKCHIF